MGNFDNVTKSGGKPKPTALVDPEALTKPKEKPEKGPLEGPSENAELWSWIRSQRICELEGMLADAIQEMHRANEGRITEEELVGRCLDGTAPHGNIDNLKAAVTLLRDDKRRALAEQRG